jgi:hypothetical protein
MDLSGDFARLSSGALFVGTYELPAESSLDAQVPVRNRVIEWGRNAHDLAILRVDRQIAPYPAIRADRVRLCLA